VRAQADVERLRVALDDARAKLARSNELASRNLIPTQALETAQITVRSAEAQLRSSQAAVTQAQATLNQNEVNLQHTVIEAPIDGIVVSRNVDVGQTVAASFNAPILFVIAADLTKMRVNANVDEADVGRIRPGQRVRFRVDAYPNEDFIGTVSQIRLQPQVVQNVVTYATVIDVPNPDLKLKPGMTATVNIEVARRDDVLRIPNAALRFRPTSDTFAALGQPTPPELQRGSGRGPDASGSASASGPTPAPAPRAGAAASAPATTAPGTPAQERTGRPASDGARGRADAAPSPASPSASDAPRAEDGGAVGRQRSGSEGTGDPSERRRQFMERLQNMPPEERELALQRMRERGFDPTAGGGSAGGPGGVRPADASRGPRDGAGAAEPGARAGRSAGAGGATWQQAQTIDALFRPLPEPVTPGRAWLYVNNQLKLVRLRLGVTDGTNTEIVGEELQPGAEVVTTVQLPNATAARATGGQSPLMPQRPGGPPGGRMPGAH
jgi:HlyD family secretion protein